MQKKGLICDTDTLVELFKCVSAHVVIKVIGGSEEIKATICNLQQGLGLRKWIHKPLSFPHLFLQRFDSWTLSIKSVCFTGPHDALRQTCTYVPFR